MAIVALVAPCYFSRDVHRRFAEAMLLSARSTAHKLLRIAVVNGVREGSDDLAWVSGNFDRVIINDRNIVARAWNRGCEEAFLSSAQYAVIANTDIIFNSHCIDELVDFAHNSSDCLIWGPIKHPSLEDLEEAPLTARNQGGADSSCFMVGQELFEAVGKFDEEFVPAYYEDSDMFYRIRLSGREILSTHRAKFFHFEHGTVTGWEKGVDSPELKGLANAAQQNRERYILKWGGDVGAEMFKRPFNR